MKCNSCDSLKPFIATAMAVVCSAAITLAQESEEAAESFIPMEDEKIPKEVEETQQDHLEPVDPYPYPPDYSPTPAQKLLEKRLGWDEPYFARMKVLSAFRGSSCIRLYGDQDHFVAIGKSKEFFLTLTSMDKLDFSVAGVTEEEVMKKAKIKTMTGEVDKVLALRLHALWHAMILRTRYTEAPTTGLDGVTFEFSTPLGHGSVWTPMAKKSPRRLAELGMALIHYCEAPADKRADALKEIDAKAAVLEKYLTEHPVK